MGPGESQEFIVFALSQKVQSIVSLFPLSESFVGQLGFAKAGPAGQLPGCGSIASCVQVRLLKRFRRSRFRLSSNACKIAFEGSAWRVSILGRATLGVLLSTR
jgi:hypothetical protein